MTPVKVRIRAESPADVASVRQVNEMAFPGAEAQLVDRLRLEASPFLSLVAEHDDEVVGHVLFTPVTVESDRPWRAMALGPMAVRPDRQRRGMGSRLVRTGLAACLELGEPVVFVLGHPPYYPRFGFVPARPRGLTCQWEVPDDVFMVAELIPGALAGRRGKVRYHPAFAEF